MTQYLKLLEDLLADGKQKNDRTGTGTLSLFGYQMRFDMTEGFPLLTTKKLHTKSIIEELIWFLKGSTNIDYLNRQGVTIWDEWANESGDLGPIYGAQWRDWNGQVDQIKQLIYDLQANPDSRRLIVSAWNVSDLPYMALAPCHTMFQCYVLEDKLSMHMYQRSADAFLGVPFNIASYGLLLEMLAQIVNLKPSDLIISYGDIHLYNNHIEQAKEQLFRVPRKKCKLVLNKEIKNIDDFKAEHISFTDYKPYPHIKAQVAI